MLAHSEELGRNSAHKIEVCPRRGPAAGEHYPLHSGGALEQPPLLARHLATKIFDKRHYPGEHTAGVNQHGVAVANNMALMRGIPEASAFDVVPGGIIWTEFLQLVLERAASARAGAALIGERCGTHGLSCDSGAMIAVADPREAWWVELAREGQWIAQRVRSDQVAVRANCYRIGTVDLDDDENVMCSPTLMDFARRKGWYREGDFDFAATYGDPANQASAYNLDRHAACQDALSGIERIGASDLMRFLREVYQGTSRYKTRPDGSPFRTEVRTIARMNTEASIVVELREHLPAHVGHLMWCSLATSLFGVYLPFHLGIDAVEAHFARACGSYDPESAYWLFTELSKLADYGYTRCIDTITSCWKGFEDETACALAEVESRAAGLGEAEACRLLTDFDRDRAQGAIARLRQLLPEVKTRVFYEDF